MIKSLPPVIESLFSAAQQSCDEMRENFSRVKYISPIDGKDSISFFFKDEEYTGWLEGENADYCLGFSEQADKSIAMKVFLAGHCNKQFT